MTEQRKTPPAYLWYPRDFDMDEEVKLMTYEEEGIYRRLLDHQWFHGGIPADLALTAKLVPKVSAVRFRKCWLAMAAKFEADGARLVNRKLERVRAEYGEFIERRSRAGRRGAEARWRTA